MKTNMSTAITSHSSILCILFLLIVLPATINAQTEEVAEFTVKAGSVDRIHVPVAVSLENLPVGLQSGQVLQLYELRDGQEHPITSQLDENGFQRTLRWILSGDSPAGTTRTYILKKEQKSSSVNPKNSIRVTDNGEDLTLRIDGKNVLSYRHAIKSAPQGVSELYSRSGYIHPLWSPGGEVITRIQPPDH